MRKPPQNRSGLNKSLKNIKIKEKLWNQKEICREMYFCTSLLWWPCIGVPLVLLHSFGNTLIIFFLTPYLCVMEELPHQRGQFDLPWLRSLLFFHSFFWPHGSSIEFIAVKRLSVNHAFVNGCST